jgi:hypothetical protein
MKIFRYGPKREERAGIVDSGGSIINRRPEARVG